MKGILLHILLLTMGLSVSAQDIAENTEIRIIQYRYSLEQNNLRINDIEVDHLNRVLVATDKLLFTITDASQEPDLYLSGKDITCVTTDKDANIYAGGNGTLYLVSQDREVKIPGKPAEVNDIRYFKGRIWIATDKGAMTYRESTDTWKTYTTENTKLKSNRIHNLSKDTEDILWIATDKGYVRYTGDKWKVEDKREKVIVTKGNKEGQWMMSYDAMWLIDPYNRKYDLGLDENFYAGNINDFVIDSKGKVYLASDILVRYDPYEETVEKYGEDVGLLTKRCLTLACDMNNTIWIGTEGSGLFRIIFEDNSQDQLYATPFVEKNLTCNGDKNGKVKIITSGGIKPYTYKWSDPSLKGDRLSNLGAGLYAVTVTDKINNTFVTQVGLQAPQPIELTLIDEQRISQNGKADGYIEVDPKGGTGDLTYLWSNGHRTANPTGLNSGKYTVTVTDKNGCKATGEYQVQGAKYIPDLDISKVNIGQKLRINDLNFGEDVDIVQEEHYIILDEVYDFLMLNQNVTVEIGGHTNTIPSHQYCDELSTKRAKSVQEYIVKRGISPDRVQYKGYGKREPLTESKSTTGRRKNQRVEVTILSM